MAMVTKGFGKFELQCFLENVASCCVWSSWALWYHHRSVDAGGGVPISSDARFSTWQDGDVSIPGWGVWMLGF